eukprot:scaffold53430_cov60-Cyclotella_meneghiniana.AAC.5
MTSRTKNQRIPKIRWPSDGRTTNNLDFQRVQSTNHEHRSTRRCINAPILTRKPEIHEQASAKNSEGLQNQPMNKINCCEEKNLSICITERVHRHCHLER